MKPEFHFDRGIMTRPVGVIIAALLGLLVSAVAAWGVITSVTSAPSSNPAVQAPVVVYGTR